MDLQPFERLLDHVQDCEGRENANMRGTLASVSLTLYCLGTKTLDAL